MTVSISIPVTHWGYTKGKKRLRSESSTLIDAISHLNRTFPDIDGHFLNENGQLQPGIEVLVNDTMVFPFDPRLKLKPGDQIRISSIITGG